MNVCREDAKSIVCCRPFSKRMRMQELDFQVSWKLPSMQEINRLNRARYPLHQCILVVWAVESNPLQFPCEFMMPCLMVWFFL